MCTVATNNADQKCSDEEMFNWSASTQFWESQIGIALNKYDSKVPLTKIEKETLEGWFENNNEVIPSADLDYAASLKFKVLHFAKTLLKRMNSYLRPKKS